MARLVFTAAALSFFLGWRLAVGGCPLGALAGWGQKGPRELINVGCATSCCSFQLMVAGGLAVSYCVDHFPRVGSHYDLYGRFPHSVISSMRGWGK